MARKALPEYSGRKESKQYSQKVLSAMSRKSQKISRGNSISFVHDYHHAAEIMGDSEGFDSSCRVDTEMAASEGSCAPKRKCISVNVDNSDSFAVPMQIISVSKMCHSEREELKVRLREELKQIQMLQKKVTQSFRNGIALSSSSDIHSSGQKRPLIENFQRSSETLSVKGKKRVHPGKDSKRGVSGRSKFVKQAVPSSTSHVMLIKQCESLLLRMMEHKYAWVFNSPVDIVKLNIPDYFTIIKHPMDFGTIKSNITSGAYSSPLEFLADVRLTFSNALSYNPPGSDVHLMAIEVSKYFEMRWKTIKKKLPAVDSAVLPLKSDVLNEKEAAKSMHPSKKRKTFSMDNNVKPDIVKAVMTEEEKHKLSRDLESLTTELPSTIIDFFRENSCSASQIGEDEIEVDVDELSGEMLLKLRKLVDELLQEREASHRKAEHCEMEVLNESGVSNLSMQPCKVIDPVDEDVDIGGNDPPISSYPPVEIEKDTALRNSKCSSSSSSSSDSGSSSSDSDSGRSSGNESEGDKASPSFSRIKETLGSGEDLDQKRSDLVEPHDGNQSVSGLDQVEQACQPRPASVEADSCQDGGGTQSERQVSPDKLYRAALLRSRFADTILKAREKTLNQGEKGDPDKLRREREEHERKQKEEKARILAEAKAAEDARRQAEAEAAAEAKRKRELEREAARQALLQMEKTVEINENCQFLEDLEMLRVVPAEHVPSSVDETSPDHSEDGIGGFKLLGSNPLEQLGLYMKKDDEEEEEGEANNVRDTEHDVEEGEID